MVISNVFYKQIQDQLESGLSSKEDFMVSTDYSSSYNIKVVIKYLYVDEYKFNIGLGDKNVSINMCPGETIKLESYSLDKSSSIPGYIRMWVRNIENEIRLAPQIRLINEHKTELDKKIEKLDEAIQSFTDEKFTKIEVEDLKTRLNKLEEEFTHKLKEEITNKEKLEREIQSIEKEVQFLKTQLDSLTKANWMKAFFVKTFKWGQRNPEVIKALGGMAKEMLPEGVKEHIPDGVLDLIPSEQESVSANT